MIRVSKHSIKFSNKKKLENLEIVLREYRRCAQHFIDYLWANCYTWIGDKDIIHTLDIKNNKYDTPNFITSDIIKNSKLETFLTGRLLKCCMTQVIGMIKSAIEKQRKRIYILKSHKEKGKTKKQLKLLIRKLKQNIPQKPDGSKVNLELNSICADFKFVENKEFDGFLQLKCLTKDKIEIRIPIKFSKHSNKLKNKGVMLNSFLIRDDCVDIRWEYEVIKKEDGETIGCDQGLKTVLTCSNADTTPLTDIHGHSLDSILYKVVRKKKGSKAFKRAKEHQKNFVNWSINQLKLDKIKQINLEEIWNIGYRNKTNRKLSHWQNTIIRDKVERICEDNGIRLIYQTSTYMSQRCCCCGNVRKANRKGKVYSCVNCGNEMDADLNAAKNHEINLPEVTYELRRLKLNRDKGFIWNESGFYDLEGRSLQSLPHVEDKTSCFV